MARIWKKPYHEVQGERLHLFVPLDQTRKRLEWVYFVQVCSFTFTFASVEQIAEYLEYYSHKIKPSSRGPEFGEWPDRLWAGDHGERQGRFAQLPLYLYSEPKRQKVVKALKGALKQFRQGPGAKGRSQSGPDEATNRWQFRL